MAITTKVVLIITLFLPEQAPIMFSAPMESLAECWQEAQELTGRAEEGPLRILGGSFSAACSVRAQPSQEH